jgi:NarL family two-component system sensor histidine kinase YdfH
MNAKSLPSTRAEPDERPFFFFLTFVLVGLYVWSIINVETLHQPLTLILFTALMLIHLGLHWSLVWISSRRAGWDSLYLVLQGILAFIIIYLGGNIGVLFGLYMALIGESIGVFRKDRLRLAISLAYYILLSLASYYLTMGPGNVFGWALFVLPMSLFVIIYVVLYSRQGEARERAQILAAELETANRQLSEYAARVEDLTIANERQRMARELHDTLSQGLAGLILQLEAADAHLTHDQPERAQEIVRDAMERARAALSNARRVIGDLREPTDVLPLNDAIRREADRFTQAAGIPCEIQFHPGAAIPDALDEPILRIVAEALTNIERHAQATRAGLNLSTNRDEICVEIWDDGVGFDVSKTDARHYGLLGMRERARLAGGRLEVQSEAGKGTRLTLRLPIAAE